MRPNPLKFDCSCRFDHIIYYLTIELMSRQMDISTYLAKRNNKAATPTPTRTHQPQPTPNIPYTPILFPFQSSKFSNTPKNQPLFTPTAHRQHQGLQSQKHSLQVGGSENANLESQLRDAANRRQQPSGRKAESIIGQSRGREGTGQQLQEQPTDSEGTEAMQEPPLAMATLGFYKRGPPDVLSCASWVLIGPFDTILAEVLEDRLEKLMVQCNKRTVLEFIRQQMSTLYLGDNLDNLEQIEDEQFWCQSMQRIVELLQKSKRCLVGSIRTLPYTGIRQSCQLSRMQVLLLVACMFLCIVPRQPHCNLTSFFQLMTIRPADAKNKHKPPMRLQKLKCVINYLKEMCKDQTIYQEKLVFQRNVSYDYQYLTPQTNKRLTKVFVSNQKIESGYCEGALVDFANSGVGGGFLTNGCAQEEILFSNFPELSIIKLICEELREEEAVVVSGARRFNLYSGYSHSFRFEGTYPHTQHPAKSIIVAVDAVDYSSKLSKSLQYSKKFISRQMQKMYVGVEGACALANYNLKYLYTGKWGCGIFGGDEYLKFCVQWMVCSHLGLEMKFMQEDNQKVKEMGLLGEQLEGRGVMQLFGLIEHYGKESNLSEKGLLNYIKEYS